MKKQFKHMAIIFGIFIFFSLIFFIFLNDPKHWNGIHEFEVVNESFQDGQDVQSKQNNEQTVCTPNVIYKNLQCKEDVPIKLKVKNVYSPNTFFNYFYFCTTTFSSVGYGDMSPKSEIARFVVILFHLAITVELVTVLKDVFPYFKGEE